MLKALRGYFLSGLLVLVPVVITIWVLVKFVTFVEIKLGAYFVLFLKWAGLPVFPGYGIVSVLLLVMATGLLTKLYIGRWFISIGDRFLGTLPVVSRVYKLIKQVVDAFFKGDKRVFEKVVLVEFPRKGTYSIGFVTGKTGGILADKLAPSHPGQGLLSVFVATVPNPTTGFFLVVAESEVIYLDMTFETAMKIIMSFGAFAPVSGDLAGTPAGLPPGPLPRK